LMYSGDTQSRLAPIGNSSTEVSLTGRQPLGGDNIALRFDFEIYREPQRHRNFPRRLEWPIYTLNRIHQLKHLDFKGTADMLTDISRIRSILNRGTISIASWLQAMNSSSSGERDGTSWDGSDMRTSRCVTGYPLSRNVIR